MLAAHFQTPNAARDAKWRHRLYDLIANARFCERDPRIEQREDGFPYYALDVPAAGGHAGTIGIAALIESATSRGFGIAIHSGPAEPWIFSCGDLVTRRAFGTYEFPRIGIPVSDTPVLRDVRRDPAEVSIGAPPAALLPAFIQPLLRRYFRQNLHIDEPGALAMLCAQQFRPSNSSFGCLERTSAIRRDLRRHSLV